MKIQKDEKYHKKRKRATVTGCTIGIIFLVMLILFEIVYEFYQLDFSDGDYTMPLMIIMLLIASVITIKEIINYNKEIDFIITEYEIRINKDFFYDKNIKNIIIVFMPIENITATSRRKYYVWMNSAYRDIDYVIERPPLDNMVGDMIIKTNKKTYNFYSIANISQIAKELFKVTNKVEVSYRIGRTSERYTYFERTYGQNYSECNLKK